MAKETSVMNKKRYKGTRYKCTNCGLINETEGAAPENCVKCDNARFIRL